MKTQFLKYVLLVAMLFPSLWSMAQSLMVPGARGAWGNLVYAGAGITAPQVGSDGPDMTGIAGFGFGNPYKNLGLDLSLYVTDVSQQSDYSLSAKASRYLGFGSYLAVGMYHFAKQESVLATASGYVVASHDFGYNFGFDHFFGKITLTGGYGNGRFQAFGNSQHWFKKSGWFGNMNYRILKNIAWELEWDGFELNTAFVVRGKLGTLPWSFMLGAADLGPSYSEQTRMVASFGIGLDLF